MDLSALREAAHIALQAAFGHHEHIAAVRTGRRVAKVGDRDFFADHRSFDHLHRDRRFFFFLINKFQSEFFLAALQVFLQHLADSVRQRMDRPAI